MPFTKHAFCVILLCAACRRVTAVPEPSGPCPVIAPPGSSTPFIQYVTVVVDGKVVEWRTRQRVNGSHSITTLDSMSTPKEYLVNIESASILPPDSARRFDRCAGVRVVSIRRAKRL